MYMFVLRGEVGLRNPRINVSPRSSRPTSDGSRIRMYQECIGIERGQCFAAHSTHGRQEQGYVLVCYQVNDGTFVCGGRMSKTSLPTDEM